MTGRWLRSAVAIGTTTAALAACVDRLPDQDLRILSAAPVERLSATLLFDDYQKDRSAADARYRGRAVALTGTVIEIGSGEPGQRFVVFGQPDKKPVVRANLLDDQSAAILGAAKENPRLTLKCFCEGLTDLVVAKSCVQP
jgi:tRNA_anti-like